MLSPETKQPAERLECDGLPYSAHSTQQGDGLAAPGLVLGTQYSVRDHRPDQLTGRLDQLRDPAQLAAAIGEALRRCGAEPAAIDAIHITYCKIKPGRDINAAFDIHVRWPGGEVQRLAASGTLWGSVRRGHNHSDDEAATVDRESLCRRPELARFDHVTAFVPDLAMQFRLFPADPVLHGLAPATDVNRIAVLLQHQFPAWANGGWRLGQVSYTPLHYKPKRSCTLRYTAVLHHATAGAQTVEFYGKVYRDGRAEYCHRWLQASHAASSGLPMGACGLQIGPDPTAAHHPSVSSHRQSRPAWRAAAPVVFAPEWNFVLQSSVAGRQFRNLFAELTHDNATERELARVERCLCAIARAIHAMQSAPVRFGPRLDFAALLARQANNLAYLSRWQPALAARVAQVRDELARLEPTIPANPLVLAHGDFAHGNVLVDELQMGDCELRIAEGPSGFNLDSAISHLPSPPIGVIDFDRAGQAEPAYDVAYFLTHVWSFGIRHPRRMPHVARLYEAFRNEYLARATDVLPQRLALYEAMDFAAYVLRNFRKQSHQPNWLAWAEAQVDAAFDRLKLAAGGQEGAR